MKTRLKQLSRDSVIYGIGGIAARGISFFLLPVYTRIFTPAEFGSIEMLLVLNRLLGAILIMGMDSAQSNYFFEQSEEGRVAQSRLVTAILQWRLTWGTLIVSGAIFLSPLLDIVFFDGQLTWVYFAIAFVGVLFTQLAVQSAEVFRLLYRPWNYIGITLSQTVLSAVIAIILVVWFNWSILGYFTGFGVAAVITTLVGWWAIRDYQDWSAWHRDWWPRLLRFGAPLLPAALAMYVLNTVDRWFIGYYHGQAALGIYAAGAKFAILLGLAVATFRQSWWPVAMDALHSADGPELFRLIARLYLGIGVIGVVLLTALSPMLMRWFTGPAFYSAYPIVGILAWQPLFFGFHLMIAAGIWKKEKTLWVPVGMIIAALLNTLLDAWLVPEFGGIGAAGATSISFLVWNIITFTISERLWFVGYAYGIFALQIGIGLVACLIILWAYHQNQEMWKVVTATITAVSLLIGLTPERTQFVRGYQYAQAWLVRDSK